MRVVCVYITAGVEREEGRETFSYSIEPSAFTSGKRLVRFYGRRPVMGAGWICGERVCNPHESCQLRPRGLQRRLYGAQAKEGLVVDGSVIRWPDGTLSVAVLTRKFLRKEVTGKEENGNAAAVEMAFFCCLRGAGRGWRNRGWRWTDSV